MLTDGSTQYTYDAANRVASITTASGTTTYGYNGDGDRVSQSVNGTLTTYVSDTATPLTMLLSETNASTGETILYWHALDTLAQSDGTSVETFAYDGLGSARQLVDDAGSVGLAQTFDAYGNGYAKAGSAESSFGYSGEQVDANGFVYLRARYYNPSMGRFFQRDTFRGSPDHPLTLNPYMYGLGNPILYSDPSGNCPVLIGALLGGVIAGLVSYGYASTIYNWALAGQCGCEKQDWALRTNKTDFVRDMAFYGAMAGMVMGAIAGSGGIGLGFVSGLGFAFSGYQINMAVSNMLTEGITPCNSLDLALGIIGAVGALGGIRGAPTAGILWPTGSSSIGSVGSSIAALGQVGGLSTVLVPSISAVGASAATAVNANVLLMATGSGQSEHDSGNPLHPDRQNRATTVTNNRGEHYPDVIDPRTGKRIPFPDNPQKTPLADRAPWDFETSLAERQAYKSWWKEKGFPKVKWNKVELHHILPREFGGTNDYWNLVPLEKPTHQLFTTWWKRYS